MGCTAPKQNKISFDLTDGNNEAVQSKKITLNVDCINEILDYLSIVDIFNMCNASEALKEFILDIGFRRRMFDFAEIIQSCHISDVFKMFGQYMTGIKISERDIVLQELDISRFDQILRLITMYCSVDTLKHLDVQYYVGTDISKQYLDESMQFFHCIESLTVTETGYNYMHVYPVNDFVECIIEEAKCIKSIKMDSLRISDRFLQRIHTNNLKSLSLRYCNIKHSDDFISFLQKKPNLQSFIWHKSSLGVLGNATPDLYKFVSELVSKNIPDLETFEYYPRQCFMLSQFLREFNVNSKSICPNLELLSKFNNLKFLKINGKTIDVHEYVIS